MQRDQDASQLAAQQAGPPIRGTRRSETLVGDGNDNDIRGRGGSDILRGLGGDDHLSGGPGNDRLFGGRGADELDGGPGRDILVGGAGPDVFVYQNVNHGGDQIRGFNLAQGDTLDLSDVLQFNAGDDLADLVQLTPGTRGTSLAVDPDGGGEFTRLALLRGVNLDTLSPEQLGLQDGGPPPGDGGPGDGGDPGTQPPPPPPPSVGAGGELASLVVEDPVVV